MANAIEVIGIGRAQQLTNTFDGKLLVLGDVSDGQVGFFQLQFAPDQGFTGSCVVMARSRGSYAYSDDAGFVPIPYRALFLNGLVSDGSFTSAVITGESLIQIPAGGLSIALMTACPVGQTGTIYNWPMLGSPVL